MNLYNTRKELNLPNFADTILKRWKENETFEKSMSLRKEGSSFVFYEGPPSSNEIIITRIIWQKQMEYLNFTNQ